MINLLFITLQLPKMDNLLSSFTPIPARIIISYICNQDERESLQKINNHMSIIQRHIFDSDSLDDKIELKSKLNNFKGMKDLVMDQILFKY